MRLFAKPSASRFEVTEDVIRRVSKLMERFGPAVGDDALVRGIASELSATAGLTSLSVTLKRPELIDQPWHMLAGVAERVGENDPMLTARVFGFSRYWQTQAVPKMNYADFVELRLFSAPPPVQIRLAGYVLNALVKFPVEQTVFTTRFGVTNVQRLWDEAHALIR